MCWNLRQLLALGDTPARFAYQTRLVLRPNSIALRPHLITGNLRPSESTNMDFK